MTIIAHYKPPQGNELWSDEFAANDKISPHWVRLDSGTSGNCTMRHGAGWLSMRHSSANCASATRLHALTLDLSKVGITPAIGFTMETYARVMDRQDLQYIMSYQGMADGATVGSGNQMMAMTHTAIDYQSDVHGLRDFTGYNTQVSYTNFLYYIGHGSGFYTRVTYEAANTWRLRVSQNGLNWLASATFANTLTPTHVLIGMSNYATSRVGTVSWKYVRLYDSHNNPEPYDTL